MEQAFLTSSMTVCFASSSESGFRYGLMSIVGIAFATVMIACSLCSNRCCKASIIVHQSKGMEVLSVAN